MKARALVAALPLAPVQAALLGVLLERAGAAVATAVLLRRCPGLADADALYRAIEAINDALARRAPDAYVMESGAGYALVLPRRLLDSGLEHLPPPRALVGRDEELAAVTRLLREGRLVSVVGPGGIGKSSVARRLLGEHEGAACALDLAALLEPRHLLPALAQALGMPDGATGREPDLGRRFAALLSGRQVLVLLDGCEHMIEAAATAAELLLAADPGVRILATGREALRADGERVLRLAPLALPAPGASAPAELLDAPAVRLFVALAFGERAPAPAELPLVARVCRDLDGLPLALELAAALAPRLGIEVLAAGVGQRLLEQACPEEGPGGRHLSLAAMLDWSYGLLAADEQAVLRQLSVFRGGFTLDAAAAVAGEQLADPEEVKEIVIGLMGKSLVMTSHEAGQRHRLLDTTRAYAARLHAADPEAAATRARHAAWLCRLLEQADADWLGMARAAWLARYAPWLDDVRAALDWAYGAGGDEVLAVRLTALGFPLAEQAGAGLEFGVRVGQAQAELGRLGDALPLPLVRLRLAGFAWDSGTESGSAVSAVLRAHASALRGGVADSESRMASGPLMARWCHDFGAGDYPGALATAHRIVGTATTLGDPVLALLGRKSLAQSLHFMGAHAQALAAAREGLGDGERTIPLGYVASTVPAGAALRIVVARTLWLTGDAAGAAMACADALEHARHERPVALCHVLGLAALPIAFWNRDLDACEAALEQLDAQARRYSYGVWQEWVAHYRVVLDCLALAPGPARRRRLRDCAERLARANPKQGDHLATFDPGLVAPGAYARARAGRVGWCAPEVLRGRAEAMFDAAPARQDAAAALLRRALAAARAQGALAWELRCAGSLARMAQQTGGAVVELATESAPLDGMRTISQLFID